MTSTRKQTCVALIDEMFTIVSHDQYAQANVASWFPSCLRSHVMQFFEEDGLLELDSPNYGFTDIKLHIVPKLTAQQDSLRTKLKKLQPTANIDQPISSASTPCMADTTREALETVSAHVQQIKELYNNLVMEIIEELVSSTLQCLSKSVWWDKNDASKRQLRGMPNGAFVNRHAPMWHSFVTEFLLPRTPAEFKVLCGLTRSGELLKLRSHLGSCSRRMFMEMKSWCVPELQPLFAIVVSTNSIGVTSGLVAQVVCRSVAGVHCTENEIFRWFDALSAYHAAVVSSTREDFSTLACHPESIDSNDPSATRILLGNFETFTALEAFWFILCSAGFPRYDNSPYYYHNSEEFAKVRYRAAAKMLSFIPPAFYTKEISCIPSPEVVWFRLSTVCSTVEMIISRVKQSRDEDSNRMPRIQCQKLLRCAAHQKMLDMILVHWRILCIKGMISDVAGVVGTFLFGDKYVKAPRNFFKNLKLPSKSEQK